MTKPPAATNTNTSLPSDEATPAAVHGPQCGWCHAPVTYKPVGRRRKYCNHSCRQRAYIQRKTNRAAHWVDHKEALHQRSRARLRLLTDEWGHELHHPSMDAASQLTKLWDDVWDVANRPDRDEYGNYTFMAPPRDRRPTYRDIGDRFIYRPPPRQPCPHLGTFPFAAFYRAGRDPDHEWCYDVIQRSRAGERRRREASVTV